MMGDQPCTDDRSGVIPWRRHEKPPNETWVEVQGDDAIIEAMAYFGRDGCRPHWRLRDGTCCHPSMFTTWREIPPT